MRSADKTSTSSSQPREKLSPTAPSFASFCNRYSGQTGWVVGRGPTRFDYAALGQADGPVFFVNDAVGQEKRLPENHPSFFFAHDAAMACWLDPELLRSYPVLIADQPLTGPKENRTKGLINGADDPRLAHLPGVILYRKDGPLARGTLLQRSREEIAQSGQLFVDNGTIHPLLHFAWYVGCAKLKLVGCDGLPEAGYDSRLENRSHSTQQNAFPIRVRQEAMLRRLSLPREYLGTIPHHLRMIMELRVAPENHEKFLVCAEQLLAQFRSFGCADLVVNNWVSHANGYWINGHWPNIDQCVECLISPAHLGLMQGVVGPLLEDPRAGARVAYKTVL